VTGDDRQMIANFNFGDHHKRPYLFICDRLITKIGKKRGSSARCSQFPEKCTTSPQWKVGDHADHQSVTPRKPSPAGDRLAITIGVGR